MPKSNPLAEMLRQVNAAVKPFADWWDNVKKEIAQSSKETKGVPLDLDYWAKHYQQKFEDMVKETNKRLKEVYSKPF